MLSLRMTQLAATLLSIKVWAEQKQKAVLLSPATVAHVSLVPEKLSLNLKRLHFVRYIHYFGEFLA